jgi:hypothetical protein
MLSERGEGGSPLPSKAATPEILEAPGVQQQNYRLKRKAKVMFFGVL